VAAIDVAGAGGTSWSQVEYYRARSEHGRAVAAAFENWGIPTAECIATVRGALPGVPLIASGGVRSGIDMAKAMALGGDICGIAGPFLAAASESTERVVALVDVLLTQLRVAMFATGSPDLAALKRADLVRAPGLLCGRNLA
jgi:isopentenyl-diphosphate Delta-isomerase